MSKPRVLSSYRRRGGPKWRCRVRPFYSCLFLGNRFTTSRTGRFWQERFPERSFGLVTTGECRVTGLGPVYEERLPFRPTLTLFRKWTRMEKGFRFISRQSFLLSSHLLLLRWPFWTGDRSPHGDRGLRPKRSREWWQRRPSGNW